MRVDDLTLVIPDKHDDERAAVARAWEGRGGNVLALGRFWEPPPLDPASVRCYGNDTFCLVLAQKLGLNLVSPPDDFLASVPETLLKRRLSFVTLARALNAPFPMFVKPVVPKQFGGRVYESSEELRHETQDLPDDAAVIASEVVEIEAELRTFVVDGRVQTYSVYEGAADDRMLEAFRQTASFVAGDEPVVVDWAHIKGRGWAVLEANAAWGAGLNGCDPEAALPCIERATRVAAG